MCGITGYIGHHTLRDKVEAMAGAIIHRGPDDDGVFVDDQKSVGFGFRRLSIQDLSVAGRQPMDSKSGRYTIVFNGEIYNFQDLRRELEALGQVFQGHCDTEVALAACEEWGFEAALNKFRGMFGIALYDRKENVVILARDPMGKKPVYYGDGPDGFYFASEMKAILTALPARPALNRDVAALYFQWRYVPDPYCIYDGFHKLAPGHILTVFLDDPSRRELKAYWSFRDISSPKRRFQGTQEDALNEFQRLLEQATAQRMISDVPLGAFLSGGIDSSLIVAMMQEHGQTQSFTIAFDDPQYNEAKHAKAIAVHLGTDHTEMTVGVQDAIDCMPHIVSIFDEPFGDPSAIPTYLVCKLARAQMTVAMSGDGGDESFGGYSWYRRAAQVNKVPALLRRPAGMMMRHLPLSPQMRKMGSIMSAPDLSCQYKALHSYFQTEDLLNYSPADLMLPMDGMIEDMRGYDSVMFLPGDVLSKVDRTSMAVSLEVRSPLLDRDVVEFAWTLPDEMRQGKSLLKALLARYVPQEMFDRPKQGFSIPHGQWLRSDLRDWANSLLHLNTGVLDQKRLAVIWDAHCSGKADYGHLLWTICMFNAWHREWM